MTFKMCVERRRRRRRRRREKSVTLDHSRSVGIDHRLTGAMAPPNTHTHTHTHTHKK